MPLDPFSTLGEHELAIIVEYLDPLDVIRGQLVSRLWRHYLNSEQLSKIALLYAFPQAKETLEYKKAQQRREFAMLAVGGGNHGDNYLQGEDEAIDAVLSFRRCVYRIHTRKLGQPTTLLYHILESEDGSIELDHYGVEWDVAGGYVAWIGDGTMLHVQNIHSGRRGSVDYKETIKAQGVRLRMKDPKVNMQIGDNVVCATLNFYDRIEDGFGSGRAALFMLFEAETLRYLWHSEIAPPNGKILGEVDTTRGHLSYIRKRPKPKKAPWKRWTASTYLLPSEMESAPSGPEFEVHLVVHDLMTGQLIKEVHLERGHEIAMGDVFFIVVSDSSFRRLVILYQPPAHNSAVYGYVCARIYSIDDDVTHVGRVLETKLLSRDPSIWLGPERRIGTETDIYMDYPPRVGMFDIAESVYTWARLPSADVDVYDGGLGAGLVSYYPDTSKTTSLEQKQDSSEHDDDDDDDAFCPDLLRLARVLPALNAPIIPPSIPYHTWNICTSGDKSLEFVQTRFISELSIEKDFFTHHSEFYDDEIELPEQGPQNICRRFEVFLPVADASAIFSNTANDRFKCEIGIYEEVSEEFAECWDKYMKKFRRELPGSPGWPMHLDSSSDDDSEENDMEIILEKKFLKDGFVEAGLDPANLLVPLTQTFRQKDRRPLTTKRLIHWTTPNTSATANTSDPSSSSGMASQKEQSPLSEAPRRRRKETQSALNSRSQGAPPIPDGELVPYEITPSGQILLKGEVGGSFLHSVQWTEDYLAVQNRWVVDPMSFPTEDQLLTGQAYWTRPEERHAVVVFDFSAPW